MIPFKAEPTPTVYSWHMQDVADVIEEMQDKRAEVAATLKQNYYPGLDDIHEPLMEMYITSSLTEVFEPSAIFDWHTAFPHAYYTNGSSEALFHLIARHQTFYPQVPLYQFAGEYQGYNEYAKCVGAQFTPVQFGEDVTKLPPGVFFVSSPSAIDGNVVSDAVIKRICEQHYVVLDMAYAGMAEMEHKYKLHEHIAAVVGSLSKPFGLYYYRIGFVWSQDPIMSLYGNRWFKNVPSIAIGESVLGELDARYLANKYRSWQARACAEVSTLMGVEVKPSDVWLLGHVLPSTDIVLPLSLGAFKRGPGYRLCLTPYYMEYEREAETQVLAAS